MSFFDIPDYESVERKPEPEKAAMKDVSAASQAAAASQRERARQRRGLAASILTGRTSAPGGSAPASGSENAAAGPAALSPSASPWV